MIPDLEFSRTRPRDERRDARRSEVANTFLSSLEDDAAFFSDAAAASLLDRRPVLVLFAAAFAEEEFTDEDVGLSVDTS